MDTRSSSTQRSFAIPGYFLTQLCVCVSLLNGSNFYFFFSSHVVNYFITHLSRKDLFPNPASRTVQWKASFSFVWASRSNTENIFGFFLTSSLSRNNFREGIKQFLIFRGKSLKVLIKKKKYPNSVMNVITKL